MVVQRWVPLADFGRIQGQLNRLRRGYWDNGYGLEREAEAWAIPLDVVEREGEIEIHASVPSVDPKDVQVSTEDGVLTIRAETKEEHDEENDKYLLRERRSGSFFRSLRLPDTVDAQKAQASYDKGVLTVTLPKAEDKKPRQLTVEIKETPVTAAIGG
jgi:HSP20 family protein